jgi:hypothetical protein
MSPYDPFQEAFGASSDFTFRMAAVSIGDEGSATNMNITERAATTKMEWPAAKITKPSATTEHDSSDKEENDGCGDESGEEDESEDQDESEDEEEYACEDVSSDDDSTQEDSRYDLADDSEYDSEDKEEPWQRRRKEEEDAMYAYPVDLVAYEERFGRTPIFTRDLVQEIRKKRDVVAVGMRESAEDRKTRYIDHRTPSGRIYKTCKSVWYPSVSVEVLYINHIELDLGFQVEVGHSKIRSGQIRWLNNVPEGEVDYFDAPYAFDTHTYNSVEDSNLHKNLEAMEKHRQALFQAGVSWLGSELCAELEKTIVGAAAICTPIRKIVCFGLGNLDTDETFTEPAAQHMTVFTIAKTLSGVYRQADRPIEILLQDPRYAEKDRVLLEDLYRIMSGDAYRSTLRFVDDPDRLLAVDENTFVISAFLPVQYPMPNIIANLFASSSKGPAAFLCDKLTVRTEKRAYTMKDRMSPAVARMLTPGYAQTHEAFRDDKIETLVDRWNRDANIFRYWYWLPQLYMWVRRRGRCEE